MKEAMSTCLDEVIQHEGGYAGPPPLWMGEYERDVVLVVTHVVVRHHEGKP